MSRNDKILALSFLGALLVLVAIALIQALLPPGAPTSHDEGVLKWIEPISVAITALATVALGYFTVVLARATKRLADVGEQPNVVVTFEPNRHIIFHLDMHVENTGTATAYDIQVRFDPPLDIAGRDSARPIPLSDISVLKPKQAISSSLVDWGSLNTKAFTVHTSWVRNPSSGEREKLAYSVDLTGLEGMSRLGGDPGIESAQAVKKMADILDHFASGFRKLAVNTYSASDREEEERQREERRARQQARATPAAVPPSEPGEQSED
jgi:hypothetical protein